MKTSAWVKIAAMTFIAAGLLLAPMNAQALQDALANHVRHELVTLPYFSVFDDLSYRVDGSTVTLFGQVTRPILKSEAEGAVKHVEGVTHVVNNIEVLPLSTMDDQIRVRTYRAIFGYGPLQRYSMGVIPSIHIIVKNGHVTLTGFVSTEMDKQLAYTRANGVANVFSVTNELKIDQ
jgi:hyperosmotically inducible periplasmic protein